MDQNTFKGIILCLLAVSAFAVDVCEDIRNGNGHKYEISQINDCAITLANQANVQQSASLVSCPPLDCVNLNYCPFGYRRNPSGCETCECAGGTEGHYESDIVLTQNLINALAEGEANQRSRILRNRNRVQRGVADRIPLWNLYRSGNNFVVPYIVDNSIPGVGRTAIEQAAQELQQKTCIRLKARTNEQFYLRFIAGSGCYSTIGRQKPAQEVSLGSGCWSKGVAVHEIMHALGFWHEQSRPDRDNFVDIHANNIQRGMAYNFNKNFNIDSGNSAYDIGSVMHYGSYAFSTNGRPTITDKNNQVLKTQRLGLSRLDIGQLNVLYQCSATRTTTTPTTPATAQTSPASCRDTNRYCSYWANTGECNKSTYMKNNCCASCKNSKDCLNKNVNCDSWANNGYCTGMYAPYMSKNCKTSCKLCKASVIG